MMYVHEYQLNTNWLQQLNLAFSTNLTFSLLILAFFAEIQII